MSTALATRADSVSIHPSAIVARGAELGAGVRIGPWCSVGANAVIEDGTRLVSHVVVDGHTVIGPGVVLFPFCTVGLEPQDLKYQGEPTRCEIGARTQIREHCTIHRGTVTGRGVTRVGADCLIMAVAHVAHDCQVGDHVIIANNAVMGGHVSIADHAVIGGAAALHQFVRIGAHSYIGAGTIITQDVPPFSLIVSERQTRCFGINKVGLERHGFSPERIGVIEKAYRYLLRSKLNTSQAVEKMRGTLADSEDVQSLIRFIESTTARGLTK